MKINLKKPSTVSLAVLLSSVCQAAPLLAQVTAVPVGAVSLGAGAQAGSAVGNGTETELVLNGTPGDANLGLGLSGPLGAPLTAAPGIQAQGAHAATIQAGRPVFDRAAVAGAPNARAIATRPVLGIGGKLMQAEAPEARGDADGTPRHDAASQLRKAGDGRLPLPQLFDADRAKAPVSAEEVSVGDRILFQTGARLLGLARFGAAHNHAEDPDSTPAPAADATAANPRKNGPGLGKPIAVAVAGVVVAGIAVALIGGTAAAWAVGGAILAASLIAAGILYKGAKRGQEWAQSAAFQDSGRIEDAARAGDAKALAAIADEVKNRYQSMQEAIRKAEAAGSSTLDDPAKTPVAKAKRLVVYDYAETAKAKLYHNALSNDAASRIGLQTLAYWQQSLKAKDEQARSSGFEGYLALELRALDEEVGKEHASIRDIETTLEAFEKLVPDTSGQQMRAELDTIAAELRRFSSGEVDAESNLGQGLRSAMYSRVSSRFYQSDPEFKRRQDHRDRLQSLLWKSLGPTTDLAVGIDKRLQAVVEHLQQEQQQLVEAERHLSVPVEKVRRWKDEQGVEHEETYTDYENQSGPYRERAAQEGRQAYEAAVEARGQLERLYVQVPNLRQDPVVIEEQLEAGLPYVETGIPVEEGGRGTIDLDLPPARAIELAQRFIFSAQDSRGRFAPIVARLASVRDTVSQRSAGEQGWLSGRVYAEIDRQEKQASKGGPNPAPKGSS